MSLLCHLSRKWQAQSEVPVVPKNMTRVGERMYQKCKPRQSGRERAESPKLCFGLLLPPDSLVKGCDELDGQDVVVPLRTGAVMLIFIVELY